MSGPAVLRYSEDTDDDPYDDVPSSTSLNLTIAMSFFGMLWSITLYIFSTKWRCFDDQSLWESQLKPYLKKMWQSIINDKSGSRCNINNGYQYQSINGSSSHDSGEELERETKCPDKDSASVDTEAPNTQDCEKGEVSSDTEASKPAMLGGSMLIVVFSAAQILAKILVIIVNIVYLALNYDRSIPFLSYSVLQETVSLITGPFVGAIYWVCCWRQCREENCGRKFLEFLRFNDLQIACFLVPFSNVDFYILGGGWYVVLIIRLVFCAVTFAAAVIAGMRFVCACYCKVFCMCGCEADVVEIRDVKHLIVDIGFKLIGIFVKINTASSSLASISILKLRGLAGPTLLQAYLAFSFIRAFTSLWSLGFSAAMLRWAVLKKEHKWNSKSWLTNVLRILNKYEPHVHVGFFFDIFTYFGLLVVNFIALELLYEGYYYCTYTCSQYC